MAEPATNSNLNRRARFELISSPNTNTAASARPVRLRFGRFELDPKSGELTSGETRVILQRQPLELLLMLIGRCGEMVTREEIQNQLWGQDVIVDFDLSINQLVRKLRRILGDSAEAPNYIETLARRGYRFKVAVESIEKANASPAAINVARVALSTAPAAWNGPNHGEPAASRRNLSFRAEHNQAPQRLFRCRHRGFQTAEEHRNSLAPLRMGMVSAQPLREYLNSASTAERLDALRQLLFLLTELLETAAV
jgi:DNA-binding winged helix-turn-helix (wHTH) protein